MVIVCMDVYVHTSKRVWMCERETVLMCEREMVWMCERERVDV